MDREADSSKLGVIFFHADISTVFYIPISTLLVDSSLPARIATSKL